MIYFFQLLSDSIVKDLESALTNIKKERFNIKYTNSKGTSLHGKIIWDKTKYPFTFVIHLGHQKTIIVNDQSKIIMNVDRDNSTDRVKPKDITDNPLSSIFKSRVRFVEHSESLVQAQSKKLSHKRFQVILHKFTDTPCQKEHLILEYEKIDKKVILKKWITVTENKRITIDFL